MAIDLGSHNVTAAAAVRGANGKMVIEAVVREKSEGVSSGAIDNIELAVKSLKTAVDKLQEELNIKVFEAYFGISGEFIRCASHNDWVAVGDYANGVSQSDVDELYARMEKVSAPSDDEVILERIPQNFVVDGNKEVPNAVGAFGKSLSSTFNFILSLRTPIQRLTNAALKLGIKPLAIHINPLVTAETLLETDEKEEGIAVVDMGSDVTDLTIYYNNVVRYVASIPIGSNAINNDIRSLSIPEKWVEKMKVKYGNAVAANVNEEAGISYNTAKGKKVILQCNLAAAIEARVRDIADLVIEEIKCAGYDRKLPYGIVLTGGGANLEGIADAFTKHTGIDTRIGVPDMVVDEESTEMVDGPEYATIVGLLWNALQGGTYCMVDQRPQPAQPAQPSQPAPPTVARVGGADLDVEVGVGHAVADLLKGASRGEHGKGGGDDGLARGGQTRGDAHHVALGDTAVKEAVGVGLGEVAGFWWPRPGRRPAPRSRGPRPAPQGSYRRPLG